MSDEIRYYRAETPAAPGDVNAGLRAQLDAITAERDALKASAGAVALPDDLEGKIAALKSVTKAGAAEVMGVIREALGIPAPTEPE